jgi:cytochrome c556
LDKDIKNLKGLIEEEQNEELVRELEENGGKREQEFKEMLREITRVASEIRDAKRFDVYR